MIKRIAGMVAVSVVLSGAIALYAPALTTRQTQSDENAEPQMTLQPAAQQVAYTIPERISADLAGGAQDVLQPAAAYKKIFPYAASIVGWKDDGTPVYRYAIADADGEQLTQAVYTQAQRALCGSKQVWLLTSVAADGSTQMTCAADDGSWVIGPITGTIAVKDSCILRQLSGESVTTVYNGDGKSLGSVMGSMQSCADGVLVSEQELDGKKTWYFYDASTMAALTQIDAVQVGAFSGGSATVQVSKGQWGAVNKKGVITLFNRVVWADEMRGGYALAKDTNGKFGVVDAAGKVVLDFTYSNGKHCSDSEALYQLWTAQDSCEVVSVGWKNKKLVLPSDVKGQELTPLPDNYFAYTNAAGHSVIFDDLKSIELEGEAVFYQQNGKLIGAMSEGYQIFDLDEETLSGLRTYAYMACDTEAAEKDGYFTIVNPVTGLQGIGNTKAKTVLRAGYDSIESVGGGYFTAVQNGWTGIIDSHGTWMLRTQLAGV